MKNIILGTLICITVTVFIVVTDKHHPFSLLLLVISLFLILKGYLKLIANDNKKEKRN